MALLLGVALSACQSEGNDVLNVETNSSSNSSSVSSDGTRQEQISYTISEKVTRLNLEGRAGTISVTAADGPISVTEHMQYRESRPVTSHQVNGDVLNLRNDGCPERSSNNDRCEVDWEIRAPAGTNLELNNRAGGIELNGMSGSVTAKTHSGGVEGRDLATRTITAESSAGGVELQFREPPNQLNAITEAGGVELQLPADASYAVQADTDTGDPEIGVRQDANSPYRIKAQTDAGDIEITSG